MMMRLQKYLALCGVASRRTAEKMIAEGHVTVDGVKVTEMGVQVEVGQDIRVDGRLVTPEPEKYYIMYHKPAGEVTTASDPEGRATVLDKFRDFPARLYPVGRLDYDSEGLLLLTNDGDLTERMLHPSREVDKVYLARVSNTLTPEEARRLENGVMVDGRRTARAKCKILGVKGLYTDILVSIHEGRNRQVRKMVEQVGHQVVMLRRIRFGPLKLEDLPRGMWRELTPEEVRELKKL
ncbi:MAG: pseudouridine synthase [bacterium]|nr:pseudouridine synthase [bacterium]